jgi:D-serine deaminase-like pyridoxal phosphate-dependent protein
MPQYPYPDDACMTPCFVIFEDAVRHNLARTVAACGGAQRLMPHVKTHRAPWLIQLFSDLGVKRSNAPRLPKSRWCSQPGRLASCGRIRR